MDTINISFCLLTTLMTAIISSIFISVSSAQQADLGQTVGIMSMWDDNVSMPHLCDIQNIGKDEAAFAFDGDPKIFCGLNITVPNDLIISIKMPIKTSDLFYLFYEGADVYQNRYVVVNRQTEQCFTTVGKTGDHLKIHLLGNASVLLRFVLSDVNPTCLEDLGNRPSGIRNGCTSVCSNLSGYTNMVTCESGLNGELQSGESCRLSFPKSCNIALKYREGKMKCGKPGQQDEKFLIVYPNIDNLDLSSNKIVDIAENSFQGLTNLEILNLAENWLEYLPNTLFHDLTELRELFLSDNQLTMVNKILFETHDQLTVLNLKGNTLTQVDVDLFENLANLTHLYLYENNLTMLPLGVFSNLYSMKRLGLQRNQFTVLDVSLFQNMTDLEYLNLSGNKLTTLPNAIFQGLENLVDLYLSKNMLSSVSEDLFYGLKSLNTLTLFDNQLISLPSGVFRGLINLTQFYIHDNQLLFLNSTIFQDLQQLSRLALLNNSLTYLPGEIFTGLKNLEHLYLYNNKLATLSDGLFQNLYNLKLLYLYGNVIETLPGDYFTDLISLQVLDLEENKLSTITNKTFNGLYNLTTLYLRKNPIETIESGSFRMFSKLNNLWCNEMNLTELPLGLFDNVKNLEIVSFSKNKLLSLHVDLFPSMSKLWLLDLSGNNISSLHNGVFDAMDNLQTLFLYQNLLTSIDNNVFNLLTNLAVFSLEQNLLVEAHREWFQETVHLEGLVLSNNPGIKLDSNIFTNLTNLKNLFLSKNNIKDLQFDIFQDVLSLHFLDLSGNRLHNIPDIRHLNQLTYLNLQENPLSEITINSFVSLPREAELFVTQHEICDCYTPVHVNCSAAGKRSPYLTCDRLLADRTLVTVMWVIGLNALGGNLFVLAWRKAANQKNKVQALLLSSLAMSDFLMGVYMIIIASADIYFGDDFPLQSESWRSGITCRVAGTLSILSSQASVFFVALISIDRFISVRLPYSRKKLSQKSAPLIVGMTWVASLALGIAPSVMAGRSFKFYDNSHVCIGLPLALTEVFKTTESVREIKKEGYRYSIDVFSTESQGLVSGVYFSTALFLGLNLLCYLTIFVCYFEIVRAVYKSSKRAGLNKEMKEQLRMTAKVAAIVITDFACWFPIIMLGILVQTKVITLPPSVFAWCVTFVLPINSAINPYLYTIAAIVSIRRKEGEVSVTRSHGLSMHSRSGAEIQVYVNTRERDMTLPNVPMDNDVQEYNI